MKHKRGWREIWRVFRRNAGLLGICFTLSACVDTPTVMPDAPATAHHPPAEIGQPPMSPKEATPVEAVEMETIVENAPEALGAIIQGKASFYGKPGSGKFHGRRTANGERFDRRAFTAASNRFPLGSWVAVRRTDKAACVLVWINDRMHARHKVRIIDLSYAAAEALGSVRIGVAKVEARQLPGSKNEKPAGCEQAFEIKTAEP